MPQGMVLAGGYSSRIGQNKMVLLYRDLPLICHAVRAMAPYASRIFVITGHYHDDIVFALRDEPSVVIIRNPDYPMGMFSSVLVGARAASEDVFIVPGDYPVIQSQTYRDLLASTGNVRVPTINGKKGHPLFLARAVLDELKAEPLSSNLKTFRDRHTVTYVEVVDSGILIDIDTLADHQSLTNQEKREP